MSTFFISGLTFTALLACGDKVDDTGSNNIPQESDGSDIEEDTSEDVGNEEGIVDQDLDGYTIEGGDCDDGDPNVNPSAFDNPENDVDEDCNGTPATISSFNDGMLNPSFEDTSTSTPNYWMNLGDTFEVQSGTDTMWGDNGDSGVSVTAVSGNQFIKIWPDLGANVFGDESPVYQEWFINDDTEFNGQSFYISAFGLIHESSLLKGATEAAVHIKCFDTDWNSTGESKSDPLTSTSNPNEWVHQSVVGTCGLETNVVQAVISLHTPDEDVDGNGTVELGESQQSGNVYYDHVIFGIYNNDSQE
jgi:hypothetical protein